MVELSLPTVICNKRGQRFTAYLSPSYILWRYVTVEELRRDPDLPGTGQYSLTHDALDTWKYLTTYAPPGVDRERMFFLLHWMHPELVQLYYRFLAKKEYGITVPVDQYLCSFSLSEMATQKSMSREPTPEIPEVVESTESNEPIPITEIVNAHHVQHHSGV